MAIFRGVGGSGDSSDNSFLDEVTAQAQSAEASATAAANSATSALNTELTSASFNTSSGVLTLTKQDGDTVTTDLDGRFLLTESNDLSSSVTWANVPNANITQSSVTQHEAALSITESQISDLQSYLTSYTETDPVFSAHPASGVTTTNITNWNDAYNNKITAVNYSGSTLTLTQQDGGTLTTTINGGLGSTLVYNGATKAEAVATGIDVTGDVSLGDNDKATFGASDDLQIYHNGTNSFVSEVGNGDLKLNTNGASVILQKNTGELMVKANTDSSVDLYYDNSPKLATTSTGIDVTGDINVNSSYPRINLTDTGHNPDYSIINSDGIFTIYDVQNASNRLAINSSGKVGIGTSSPSAQLHVKNNDAGFEVDVDGQVTDGVRLLAYDRNTSTDRNMQYRANKHLFNIGSSERMRIDLSGNVGIGTTSPSGKLEVSSADFDTLYLTRSTAGSATILMKNSSNNGGLIQSMGNGGLSFFSTVSNSSSEKMRIDSSGNVGIGTTSPSTTLDVHSSANGHGLYIAQDNAGYGYHTRLTFQGSNGSGGYNTIAGLKAYQETNGTNGYLRFDTNGENERMRITSSGNVGIGTTSPARKFHVSRDNSSSIVGTFESANNQAGITLKGQNTTSDTKVRIVAEGDDLLSFAGGSERMRIDSNGKVGIGTSSPAFDSGYTGVHISQTAPSIHLTPTSAGTTASDGYAINVNSSGIVRHINKENQPIEFHTNNTERLRIDSSGNLLVGKTTAAFGTAGVELKPSGETYVTRASATPLYVRRNTNDGNIVEFWKDGTSVGSIGTAFSVPYLANGSNFGIRVDDAGSGELLPTDTTGSGLDASADLGRSNIRFKDLYLSGGLRVDGTDSLRSSVDDSLINISGGNATNSGANYALYGETHGSLAGVHRWRTDGNERMRIDSSGNVGIGESSPTSKLVVNSGAEDSIATFKSTDALGYIGIQDNATTSLVGAGAVGDDLLLFSNNLERVRVDSTGNVGIGTTSPTTKLDVNGSLKASGLTYPTSDGTANQVMVTDGSGNLSFVSRSLWTGLTYIGSSNVVLSQSTPSASTTAAKLNVFKGNASTVPDSDSTVFFDSSSNNVLQMGSGAYSTSSINFGNSFSASKSRIEVSHGSNHMAFKHNYSERMRINSSGHLAIGTTSGALCMMTVHGGGSYVSASSGTLIQGRDTNNNVFLQLTSHYMGSAGVYLGDANDIDRAGVIYSNYSDRLDFNANASTRMSINSSGNVGIGTTAPLAPLDINGNKLRIRDSKTPSSATDTGYKGEICYDSNYMYVCVATNTWKRAALASW